MRALMLVSCLVAPLAFAQLGTGTHGFQGASDGGIRGGGLLQRLNAGPSAFGNVQIPEEAFGPARAVLLPAVAPMPSDGGVDPDYRLALDSAKSDADLKRPAEAVATLTSLLAGKDRFLEAQRAQLIPEATKTLQHAARVAATDRHDLQLAAVALDAAWNLGGRQADADLAAVLVKLAARAHSDSPREALWLVRRAMLADPSNDEAAALDARWSTNRLRVLGWLMMGVGAAAVASGFGFWALAGTANKELTSRPHPTAEADALLGQQRGWGLGATGAFIGGGALFYAGLFTVLGGNPEGPPTSPAWLPALPEAQR